MTATLVIAVGCAFFAGAFSGALILAVMLVNAGRPPIVPTPDELRRSGYL
jgi:hypothetical protein